MNTSLTHTLMLLLLLNLISTSVGAQFHYAFDAEEKQHFVGDTSDFVVFNDALQLSGTTSPSVILHDVEHLIDTIWEGQIQLDFSPSNSNRLDVTLYQEAMNSMSLAIGSTGPDTLFFLQKRDTVIIKHPIIEIAETPVNFDYSLRLKNGFYQLTYTSSHRDTVVSIAPIFNLNTPFSFAIACHYTSTRADKFGFDNLGVGIKKRDTISPELVGFEILDSQSLALFFNEKILLDPLTQNLSVRPTLPIHKLSYAGDSSAIQIEFQWALSSGINYQLIFYSTDLNGNPFTDSINTTYYNIALAGPGDLIITEIMADPSPSVLLPECEYLEIYNPTQLFFDLADYTLEDDRRQVFLPNYIIQPRTHYALVDSSCWGEFQHLENIIFIDDLPAINNDADELKIIDYVGRLVDQRFFNRAWHVDDARKDGGWSLEMKDIDQPCVGQMNWSSAGFDRCGSPGEANSIAEIIAAVRLSIQSHAIPHSKQISLTFNRAISDLKVEISPHISLMDVDIQLGTQSVILELEQSLEKGVPYELLMHSSIDCRGHKLEDSLSIPIFLPLSPKFGDLTINEVLFDPPTGTSDFIEIKNHSRHYLKLENICFEYTEEDSTWTCSQDGLIIGPACCLALTQDTTALSESYSCGYLAQGDIPNLSTNGGYLRMITLHNNDVIVLDSIYFNERMHSPALVSKKGISLENQLAQTFSDHWQSASELQGGATPGLENSTWTDTLETITGALNLVHISFSPNNDGYKDVLAVDIRPPDVGFNARIDIFDMNGQHIYRLLEDQILGSRERIFWNGQTEQGSLAPPNAYILLLRMAHPDGKLICEKRTCALN